MHATNQNIQPLQDNSSTLGSSLNELRFGADPPDPPKAATPATPQTNPIDQVRDSDRKGSNDATRKGKAPGYHKGGAAKPTIQVLPGVASTRKAHVNVGANLTREYQPFRAQFPDLSPDPTAAAPPPGLPPGVVPSQPHIYIYGHQIYIDIRTRDDDGMQKGNEGADDPDYSPPPSP